MDSFEPKKNIAKRYQLSPETLERVKEVNLEIKKLEDKWIEKGVEPENAKTLALFEMYIPGFSGPTFKD